MPYGHRKTIGIDRETFRNISKYKKKEASWAEFLNGITELIEEKIAKQRKEKEKKKSEDA